jgi:hypothetical protein
MNELISNASRYLSIEGMFEVKEMFSYSTYEDFNSDLNSWKAYESNLTTNSAGIKELKVDLSDSVLSGTSNSIQNMSVVIPRFQLKIDYQTY